ncbi:MAG: phosphatase PAP2 family protein [Bernardetiaceae bacterium]|nr:phosphatase PAP2 family protein [Bernardetiaceae bacterium]
MKKKNVGFWPFYLGFGLYALAASAVLLATEHGQEVLWLNQRHGPVADWLFKYATHLGDGLLAVAVGLGLLWFGYGRAVQVLASYALSGLLAQALKRLVFADRLRPAAFFEAQGIALQPVEGVEWATLHSFPSGHSASAFALAFSLAWGLRSAGRWAGAGQVGLLLLAVAVAGSRVYLAQHFLVDTLAGAGIGVASAGAVAAWLQTQQHRAWPHRRLGGSRNDCMIA